MSWKTTVTGICTVLLAVAGVIKSLADGDPSTVPDFTVAIAAITSGLGLIFARDNKVTSEQAGAATAK